MQLDIGGDHEVVDQTEDVTYFARTGEAAFADGVAVSNALRAGQRKWVAAGGGGRIPAAQLSWHVWAERLPGIVPKAGDVIQDGGGVRWVVVAVDIESWRTRYALETIRER